MECRMSEDTERIEEEIEIKLGRISVSSFEADDPNAEVSEEALSDTDTISDDLPELTVSYLDFIKNRNQDAEKVILQDLEDDETTGKNYEVVPCHASDHLSELASEYNEDLEKIKERVLFEIENEDLQIATIPRYNCRSTNEEVVTHDHFVAADVEMSISLTYPEIEEKCRQEFEQWEKRQSELEDEKRRKWKAEREAQEKENEEEHARRVQRLEKFEAERMELELLHKRQQTVMEVELQKGKKAWRDKMMQHEVTEITLEDLPACSLSTLSECSNLQVLTLRRCGLVALEGLSSCKDLKYINMEENSIEMVDCENLENLCILILNKNHISSVCGLDGCINLQNLELSYNRITRIGGLESLKNLQQLNVDHNQLISTKGLSETATLIHLDCSFNHLTQIEGIESCGLLQILKLQGNNLQELPRLENHVLLRELYLDDNSISAMKMLSLYWLPLLQILSLSQNSLTELVPLNSFVSLEKLDIKNNCLSDLKSVIAWLSGCNNLRELSLSGNPLLQERNCKPSLCKELPSLQFLDGENLNYHTLTTTERIKRSESRTFLELCQVQIEENVILKNKAVELGIASSIDAAQRQCWYFNQLMKLSIEHRCAHEYGELNVTDRDRPEALQNHLKQTSTGCLQENNLFIMGATENKQVLLDPSERWITTGHIKATFINSSIPVHQKENKEDHRVKQKNIESCINYSEESKGNNNMSAQLKLQQSIISSNVGRDLQHFDNDTERLHMAASAIQSLWKKYHARRKTNCTKTRNNHFTEVSRWKNEAATLIQASWKGFLLRRKLASALAAVKRDEVEDEYEEINVDDFMFYEAALEKEWLTLDSTRFTSKTLLFSNQLHWPKKYSRPLNSSEHSNSLQLSPQALWQCVDRPHLYSPENLHFHRSSEKGTVSQLFDLKERKKFSYRSGKEEKISEEWYVKLQYSACSRNRGFKDISTAQLMLKRAHKMEPRKYSSKKVDPAVCLALFKNNENKHLHVKPPRKTWPANAGYFEGEKEEFSQLDTTLDEKLQKRKDFTYQWLHTQLSDYEAASSKNTKSCSFLPELDPVICNSGQVQLMASPVSREDTDLDLVSMASGSALTKNREKNKQPHRHSARSSKKNVSTPEKSHLGPSCREWISFRDHPVQLSGGWGTGKKRQKVKNTERELGRIMWLENSVITEDKFLCCVFKTYLSFMILFCEVLLCANTYM
ncbi:leucine-rich repeat and IQ domain-containing protein 1 isoform X15 [Oxyura jamaicensis]|uniref:leucine-rich repeat and IQ domain-containing protein 1 isoform X15 n=1 Tax=Oxyura jamaicensis TaxID=8884 RepID=UPI0015A666E2|nr:leucine-rich repeat and IQ domain-containing protein 1 isoform X15 [Oxyura jamaicensis]